MWEVPVKEEPKGRGTVAELSGMSACGHREVGCIRHWIPGQARDDILLVRDDNPRVLHDNLRALALILLQTQRHLIQGVARLTGDFGAQFHGGFQGQFGQQQFQDAVVRLA